MQRPENSSLFRCFLAWRFAGKYLMAMSKLDNGLSLGCHLRAGKGLFL
jgi:hypothetical protein